MSQSQQCQGCGRYFEPVPLLAFLRRDWAVRVLDAWCEDSLNTWRIWQGSAGVSGKWCCALNGGQDGGNHWGDTPDAARIAAAEAVYPELPESVRAEIGERP